MALQYNPAKEIPNLAGKVFLVTGGTSGVGKEAIAQLAKHKAQHIYFTGRNSRAAEAVIAETKTASTNVTFIHCDQTSLSSVADAAKTFLEKSGGRLDVLICNAGIMAVPPSLSKDGYEIQFAVNHLAHALLIQLCLPALEKAKSETGDARIVLLTSLASLSAKGFTFEKLKKPHKGLSAIAKWNYYSESKLANAVYAAELARRYPNLTTVAVHPGVIVSTGLLGPLNLMDRIILKMATYKMRQTDIAGGAHNTLWAATSTDKNALQSGVAYEYVRNPITPSGTIQDKALGKKLWDWTDEQLVAYL